MNPDEFRLMDNLGIALAWVSAVDELAEDITQLYVTSPGYLTPALLPEVQLHPRQVQGNLTRYVQEHLLAVAANQMAKAIEGLGMGGVEMDAQLAEGATLLRHHREHPELVQVHSDLWGLTEEERTRHKGDRSAKQWLDKFPGESPASFRYSNIDGITVGGGVNFPQILRETRSE